MGRTKRVTVRVFQGYGWEDVLGFPGPAANDCAAYRWFVRWRSANPDVTIRSGADALATGPGPVTKTRPGGTGAIAGSSCYEPVFAFGRALNGNGSNLADIYVEYQIWRSRPVV
ncbi:MAG: hypothetical protein R2737_07410 [Candidatus Nanopelagicales bacterium]